MANHCVMQQPDVLHRQTYRYLASTHCQKTKHIHMGYPALHTNDRVTPGIPELHPSGIRLHVNVHKYGVQ